MFKTFQILVLLFFTSLIAQSNEPNFFIYQAYKFESSEDESSNMRMFLKQETDSIQFELKYANNASYFYPIYKIDNSQEFKISLHDVFRKSQGEFFVDYQLKKTENMKYLNGRRVIIEYDFDEIEWELTNKTEIVNDRLCKIAVNRRYETGLNGPKEIVTVAWVDESYNADIAPFGLVGLHGLIVKVNFNNNYEVILSDMSSIKNPKLKELKGNNRISLTEYYAEIERLNKERRERKGGLVL